MAARASVIEEAGRTLRRSAFPAFSSPSIEGSAGPAEAASDDLERLRAGSAAVGRGVRHRDPELARLRDVVRG